MAQGPLCRLFDDVLQLDDMDFAVDFHGKKVGTHGKFMENHGKIMENHGKIMGNHWKRMGKHREIEGNDGKSHGLNTKWPKFYEMIASLYLDERVSLEPTGHTVERLSHIPTYRSRKMTRWVSEMPIDTSDYTSVLPGSGSHPQKRSANETHRVVVEVQPGPFKKLQGPLCQAPQTAIAPGGSR